MCGITGILKFEQGAQTNPQSLRRMCAAMVHRGPDDEGVYVEGRVGLAARRLSIIDLAAGHQPLSNEDGTIWITFNGEIYNHGILREQLIARGHQFRTLCDTETIIHLYEEYGRDCVQHLRGMFAFAIWNGKTKRLFAARDRLGIKPLYYRLTDELFLFGSEIKVILAHPSVKAEFRRSALPEYLAFGYLSGPETFYTGIDKLMPGHWLELNEKGEMQIQQYWDLAIGAEEDRSETYYVNRYRELLERAISSHLMSDVPLGVFLSGGVDSSAVAALTAKARKSPIETFAVGYSEEKYSELPYARIVARHLNSIHHEVLVNEHDFFCSLPKLIWHEDEPISWPSSVALYFVARLARERVKVVLTGEGSDETMAGYTRYAFTLKNAAGERIYRHLVPGMLRKAIADFIFTLRLDESGLRRKLEHTFLARNGSSWTSFYFDNFFSAFNERDQADIFTESVASEFVEGQSYNHVVDCWERASGEMLQKMLYTDIKTYLVELLMKQDNMSMAASIESRVPFLDQELVEFALTIPKHVQIQGIAGKLVLKKALRDLLPREILYREKLGFPTPWSRWLAGPAFQAVQSLLLDPRTLERGLFKATAISYLLQEHQAGRYDHSNRIWRLLNLELWERSCLEGEGDETWYAGFGSTVVRA